MRRVLLIGLMGSVVACATTTVEQQQDRSLRKAIAGRAIFPITVGSSSHGIGNSSFLDAVVDYLPNPTEIENTATDLDQDKQVVVDMNPESPMISLASRRSSSLSSLCRTQRSTSLACATCTVTRDATCSIC